MTDTVTTRRAADRTTGRTGRTQTGGSGGITDGAADTTATGLRRAAHRSGAPDGSSAGGGDTVAAGSDGVTAAATDRPGARAAGTVAPLGGADSASPVESTGPAPDGPRPAGTPDGSRPAEAHGPAGSGASWRGGALRGTWRQLRGAYDAVVEDLDAAVARDPAATSRTQMALVSPGLHAVWSHRLTHRMWQREELRLPARMLSNVTRAVTGVEIHPGATIGRRFFIDHGMGVVIGETAEVGDDVMLYNGVNLGGRTLDKVKRHPTLGDGVTVGTGAKILGPVLVGAGAQVGANSVVVKDVPAEHVATGIPARSRPAKGATDPYDVLVAEPALWI